MNNLEPPEEPEEQDQVPPQEVVQPVLEAQEVQELDQEVLDQVLEELPLMPDYKMLLINSQISIISHPLNTLETDTPQPIYPQEPTQDQ